MSIDTFGGLWRGGLLKAKMKKVLCELLRDSSRSDRQLAKSLGVSQPTVSRLRNKLVEDGLIKQFSVVPNMSALGFELIAITSFTSEFSKEIAERAKAWTRARPDVLFAAGVEGGGRNGVMVSVHRSYTEYHNFILDVRREAGDFVKEYDTMIVGLGDQVVKPFSLKYLAELFENLKD